MGKINSSMPSAWITHVKSVYAKGKSKGMSYKQAMVKAAKSYKKTGSKAATKKKRKSKKAEVEELVEEEEEEAPKKKRRRRKKKV